jgi:5'-methylthioadenosine phosphorylase
MTQATLAVIGGSGFYQMDGICDAETARIDTPFGATSDAIVIGTLAGVRTAFLPRHGAGHRLLPEEIPQRANAWALATLGVEYVLSISAVGSLKEAIQPLHMVVPDQIIDRTRGSRPATFFGRGIVAHIGFDQPFCPHLSASLYHAAQAADVEVHRGGEMVVIEGPAFSTRAESFLYRRWGADIIGMTALPEAKLMREAGMCYATLACVTDYDTWHTSHEAVSVEMVVANLKQNVAAARRIIAVTATALPARTCACAHALDAAVITPMELVPEETKRALEPILARRGARAASPAEGAP